MAKKHSFINKKLTCGILSTVIAGSLVSTIDSSATTVSNLFTENFESGSSKWSKEKGTWSTATDGTRIFRQTSVLSEGLASTGSKSWTNYFVEADIKVTDFNKSNSVGLCARYNDSKNYYYASLSSNKIELRKKVNGISTTLAKFDTTIKENVGYKVKLSCEGSNLKVYLNNKLVLEKNDTSFVKGSIALLTNKSAAQFDNIIVTPVSNNSSSSNGSSSGNSSNNPSNGSTNNGTNSNSNLSQYSVTGFSSGNTGGGVISENSSSYRKVTNATELAAALKKGSNVKVIEIANDINLGWNEIPSSAKSNGVIVANNSAISHPILKKTGVSKIYLDGLSNVTIYSKNGAKLKHAGFVAKNSKNIVIRNIEFDELWEWDENTKGNYDRNDWDYITLENCSKVWIDHCTFGKAYDGIIDSKKGTTGLTISWCKFLPGDMSSSFYKAQFDELEKNINNNPMYKTIRNQGLSKENVMRIASPQKKTHLIGAKELDSTNNNLQVTLHHNYYKDSQDRMPRLRGGNAHIYNIVIDSQTAYEYSKLLTSTASKNISNAGYHFGITSNGCLSTEGGALLVEKSQILGVKNPLKNNQKSASNSKYTGKIQATDVIYKYGNTSFRGDSTSNNSPLSPQGANKAIQFSWNGFNKLPYSYKAEDPSNLVNKLNGNAGSGANVLILTSEQWLKTTY